ncbi:MAG: SDR family oxidoreductase [Syntrophales bacterium]|nr:SDR family oxidoreductase [Syntrophales bacterium]
MYRSIFSCKGKTALVTGGSGLIGKEIVQGLSQFGATVYVADRDEATALGLFGQYIKYMYLDVASEESMRDVIRKVDDDGGGIDILVNCVYPRTSDWGMKIEDVPFESWKINVDHHLGGYFLMCREVAAIMKAHAGGSIVNLASIYGVVAPDFSIYDGTDMTMPVAYAPIKAGIIALTKYLATYFGRDGIRVNAVSPGGIFDQQDPSFVAKYSRKTPLGRMGHPGDIVGAVLYLSSDASSFVTGHNLIVDGGWTAW